ncbi:hypothetical protein D884_03295 [Pseudomonas sp. URMO17WK12:I10]|uniref:hypothetical protein n=1 Tax=unclassified Pseudomonas TaxID=196821 RepID=UPI0004856C57|nr:MULTISPECIES: hypothetical protein [unclassified Pseudomonas]RDL18474.1 hypothetical protein F633_02840 [Pseudomonas sp. LAMO17WK12:I3]RED04032.1 hypothetical protein D884_03295 [Pseudomonas sp. URMO17WK12:I10]SOD10310.1 hypothetical protein SAMN05660967_03525 [Pseudomonas sp. URMO17WK12:I9]
MPIENRSNRNNRTRTFTLDSLITALKQVGAHHEISADLIAEQIFDQPAQQGQGEPAGYQIRSKTDGFGSQWTPWRECCDTERAMHDHEVGRFNQFGIMREIRPVFASAAGPAEVERLRIENVRLNGLKPEGPPRPPAGYGLPRYGLRWNGLQQPIAVPMDDGYWTPWHLADRLRQERDNLLEAGAHLL